MIIPSIDIMNGKAVQLRQGREKVLERGDLFALAREFSLYGDIAVIDLDAAFGRGSNRDLIKKLCAEFPCRVGGGIRTEELGREYLKAGAGKIIIGTKAEPDFLKRFSPNNLIVAVDEKGGLVASDGWRASTGKSVKEKIQEVEKYCSEFLYTQVESEGMMRGINLERVKEIRQSTERQLTAAGGITTKDDVLALERMGANSQVGMAIYTGALKLDELFISLLDFSKGLAPTVVLDESGQPLMLAFSSKESLAEALRERKGVYFSRSRNELWTKGNTSGHTQTLRRVEIDCDGDTLLFHVAQKDGACHLPRYSCWGEKGRNIIAELFDIFEKRKTDPNSKSYSRQLFTDPNLLKEKILEEAGELTRTQSRDEIVWEAADLLFFTLAWLNKHGVGYDAVLNELRARQTY